ncbi:peptidylprolyl isomerase [Crenalkalicoccus roseus]|uniref:peptidylprolyl isomerase n=1 Tax=Crenalkalicoccus roseus TaxID=1485588 RepID=UPI00107FFA4F|nr:peptidylprolyl isomerase [Crenalkalicoccus roseus]
MRPFALLLAASLLLPLAAAAEGRAPAAADPAAEDPVLARVDGAPLRASEVVGAAADVLPAELRAVPPGLLMRMLPPEVGSQLVERAIVERVLVNAARARGLHEEEEVRRRIRRAEEQELQQALLTREVSARVTEEALRARYARDMAGRRGEEEVQARHILVPTETEAREVLAEVQRPGADFAEVARRRSTGPGAQQGGDLGFFKREDMVPEFAEAAFALRPGQISPAPVRSPFGWHVIKVETRRAAPVPPFEEVRDTLRRQMMEEEVEAVVRQLREAAAIERLDQPAAPSLLDRAAPPAAEPPPAGRAPAPPQRR